MRLGFIILAVYLWAFRAKAEAGRPIFGTCGSPYQGGSCGGSSTAVISSFKSKAMSFEEGREAGKLLNRIKREKEMTGGFSFTEQQFIARYGFRPQ